MCLETSVSASDEVPVGVPAFACGYEGVAGDWGAAACESSSRAAVATKLVRSIGARTGCAPMGWKLGEVAQE